MASVEVMHKGQDVSRWYSQILTSLEYTDYLENQAGELELELADVDKKFMSEYYPATNDEIGVRISKDEDVWLDCGVFWVDEITLSGNRNGNTCSIKAVSGKVDSLFVGVQSEIYKGADFREVVDNVAKKLNYKVKGKVSSLPKNNEKLLVF